jgi:hypothetical protein
MQFQEEILDERTLMVGKKVRPSGTMDMRGSEGAARRDVSRAGFRKKGPIQDPKVEKSGKDVPVWVRTHKSPGDYAAHTAKKQHREGDKPQSKELKKQFGKTGAKKDSPVHDITVGSPKSKVKDPGQRARQFVGALKGVKDAVKSKKGVATNTPTAIDSAKSKGKKSRSGEEGAEQRGRIYSKLGMGERNPKTGVQMAKLSDSFNGKTFGEFILEASREDAEKKRLSKSNPDEWRVRNVGGGNWTTKRKSSISGQGKTRGGSTKDQTDPEVKPNEYKDKVSRITSKGKEAHHRVPLTRARELFKNKSPEERQEIRKRHSKVGVHFGNNPKNLVGLSPERHRGAGGAHREYDALDKGIKKAGQEPSKVFGAIKKLKSR